MRLIVTADDLGSSEEVNEAVREAHRNGILTSASLMVGAPAARSAVALARSLPGLRVGLHLTLVDGLPTSAGPDVQPLLGEEGGFRKDLAGAGISWFFRPKARAALAREIRAQFEAFKRTGLALDHLDAHHHMHLHPTVSRLCLEIGLEYGLRAVRLPREPRALLARMGELPSGSGGNALLGLWVSLLERRLRRAGVSFNDHLFGLAWTGDVSASRIRRLLPRLPPGLNELYCHPRSGNGELAALVDPEVVNAVSAAGVELTGFS